MPAKRSRQRKPAGPASGRPALAQADEDDASEQRRMETEELLQAQADLEESRFQYVELYESAPIGFVTLSQHGTITKINLTGAAIMGYDRQDIQGKLLSSYLADRKEVVKLLEHLRRCRSEEGRVDSLLCVKTAEGTILDINLISQAQTTFGQKVFHTALIDLTAKHQLTAHAQRMELLSSVAGKLLIGDTPRMLLGNIFAQIARELGVEYYFNYFVSPASAKLVLENSGGLSETQKEAFAELGLGQSLCGLAAQMREPIVLDHLLKDTKPASAELRRLGVRAYACYPLIARDRLLGTLSFATTSREEFSEEELQFMRTVRGLVTASMDRARLMTEISAARDAAEQANRAKDDFLATLSHELRTPLNPVLLIASEGAGQMDLPEETREQFSVIRQSIELEARLIDDLLDMTRVTRGKVSLHIAPCQVDAVLKEAITTVQSDLEQKQILLKSRFNAQTTTVMGDSVRLLQVFWNVLKNAIKFTPVGGKIRITTKHLASAPNAAGRLAIAIADTGIGMSPDELERIFRPFSQGDHAATSNLHSYGGLGLGLAISKTLVELHSGMIYAKSRGYGKGAAFVIELPLAEDDELAGIPVQAVIPREFQAVARPTQGGRILLVEDHEPTRAALGRLLVRRRYEVVSAASVAEAFKAAGSSKKPFDLLISDIGLPDGTGYDLMAALSKRHALPGIALTGYGTEQDVARSQEAGFVAHLTKPVSVQALERAMAAAMNGARPP